ncbi:unnamed protein product [Penicillium manginii]
MQLHPPNLVFPAEIAGASSPSQLSDGQSNGDGHPLRHDVQNDMTTATSRAGLTHSKSQMPVANEVAAWVSPMRPIEIEFNFLGGKSGFQQGLIRQAQQVLESALVNATQAIPVSKSGLNPDNESVESVSPEFLAWMLQDIGSAKGGSYVWDYFKHVSKSSLKHMGLSLLSNQVSTDEKDIFTVCLSAAAQKFLVTILASGEHDDELADHLQQRMLNYKRTALAALNRIRLMTTPSLSLLQAILCGIFIHQGSGNAQFAYELTRTACRVATDLELHLAQPRHGRATRTEEESFCLLWCYMLDKNYAWKFEPRRWYFDPGPGVIDQHVDITTSELLNIYLIMAQVQDEALSLSKTILFTEARSAQHTLRNSTEVLLKKMERVRQRIEQIASSPSICWKGLEPANEITAIQFAYNSIRTEALYLSEKSQGQSLGFGDLILRSARQELSSLVAICLISEKNRAVGFLHWTLIYYPLTAWFVLFCNTVTSSHLEDLNLLKTLATVLMPNVSLTLSQSHFAIENGDAGIEVENPSSSFHSQSLRRHVGSNSAIAPISTNNTASFPSDVYETCAPNEQEDSAAFDILFSNPLSLDFSDDLWHFDSC